MVIAIDKARFPYDRYHRCNRCDRWEKKIQRSQRSLRSYETTFQRLQRQQSLRYKKFYLSDRCRCDRWRVVSIWSLNFFFSAIAAIRAVVAWYGNRTYRCNLYSYRNNHPPFLLNCCLYALQTYQTHSSKLQLLLVLSYWGLKTVSKGTWTEEVRNT